MATPHPALSSLVSCVLDNLPQLNICTEVGRTSAIVLVAGAPLIYASLLTDCSSINLRVFGVHSSEHTQYQIAADHVRDPQVQRAVAQLTAEVSAHLLYQC